MFEQRYDKKCILKCHDDESAFPIEVLNQWDITELEIIGGNFNYFPEDISILKNLKKLSIISTKISNLPKEIFLLPNLTYLSLKNNRLSNLPKICGTSSLQTLILGRNFLFTKSIDDFFFDLPKLTNLDLGHNNLDLIPESLFILSQLKRLNL
jgi:internalin A